ncbi:hypothetical protein BDP27DRAFT_1327782, partial [Rhodocollybia butyracea]
MTMTLSSGKEAPCLPIALTPQKQRRASSPPSDETDLIHVTVIEGDNPPSSIENFADYCTDPGDAPATSVPTSFTVENGCNFDMSFSVQITDSNGDVTSSGLFTLNAAGDEWQREFNLPGRPSTAVITTGRALLLLLIIRSMRPSKLRCGRMLFGAMAI